MKSYSLRVEGASTVLTLDEVPVPEPGPGQVLVRLHAAGLNRGEFIPGGLVKGGAAKPAGIEGAGEIVALGGAVTGLKVGSRVMGRCPGAFSEFAVMDAREALPVPAGPARDFDLAWNNNNNKNKNNKNNKNNKRRSKKKQ